MKTLIKLIILIVILVFIKICYSSSSEKVLWNDECPSPVSENEKERISFKKDIPEDALSVRVQLDAQYGPKISEPNEILLKEIALTEKVVKEVFQPGIIPTVENLRKEFFLSDINLGGPKEKVLNFRVKTDKYIVQFMKREFTIYVTVKLTSGQTIDIPKLSEDIFNKRIWPLKWEDIFYLKLDSKILKAGTWIARDNMILTSSGEYEMIGQSIARIELAPIGEGVYGNVTFYTNNKFVIFTIVGGPKPLKKM
jgi:hypothetical protein